MDELLFTQLKELLVESEHLFTKLRKTGLQYENIDFDESGLYDDEEETALRHWDKLSSKIANHLNEYVEDYAVTRLSSQSPDNYSVSFQILQNEAIHTITVNYNNEKELLIT